MQANYSADKPGAALLVAVGGEVLYSKGFGLADLATATPITPVTNFRLASVSKQFTAMCIHLLQRQKLLQYDDTLLRFFPGFNKFGEEITLRHLLTHTSGLPDYENFIDADRPNQVSDEEVLELMAAQNHTLFNPGTQYYYSNTGYVLLALVVEQVSGLPYGDFLQQNIFDPLGMHTSRLYEAGRAIPERAMGYACNKAGEVIFSDQSTCTATKGDGCIYTSLQDYLKWHKALEQEGPFGIERALKEVSTNIDDKQDWYYGMGWFFAKRKSGRPEMYHTGNTCGFSNLVIRIPENDALVACFSNIADNPHLLTNLLDVLEDFPGIRPESDLVRHLVELTR